MLVIRSKRRKEYAQSILYFSLDISIPCGFKHPLTDLNAVAMSGSPEDTTAECLPESSRSSLSASSNGPQQSKERPGTADDKLNAPIEKTISCVSCRKRKLKCDRVKPKCGTCTRLRHECEYPVRRRNMGSKRRNMKELEARLGTPSQNIRAQS